MLRNKNIVNLENSKRLYCTCKQVNDPMKPMMHYEKRWNWFHWDCVGNKDSPNGLDYICKESQTIIGRERNCGNETGSTALESQTTTDKQFIHPIPSSTVNNNYYILHNNNIIHVKNKYIISHMNINDTNDSKYTTYFCDTEQH